MSLRTWRRALAVVFSALALLGAAQVQAQMLFLSTAELSVPDGLSAVNRAYSAFGAEATARSLTMVDRRGALSGATSVAADIAAAKVLVVMTVYQPTAAARMAELATALQSRPDLLVVSLIDGCCSQPDNINAFMTAVNTVVPPAWGALTPVYVNANVTAPLNTASLYQAPFSAAGLSSLVGGYYSSIRSVPSDYALYLDPAPAPATPAGTSNAYGFFLPQQASNGGRGACLFTVSDASPYLVGGAAQWAGIASAFTTAGLDPAGACRMAPAAADMPATAAVPTLDLWALLALAGLLPLLATARRRATR